MSPSYSSNNKNANSNGESSNTVGVSREQPERNLLKNKKKLALFPELKALSDQRFIVVADDCALCSKEERNPFQMEECHNVL